MRYPSLSRAGVVVKQRELSKMSNERNANSPGRFITGEKPEITGVIEFGVRAYRYSRGDQDRVAIHLPHGASALDLSVGEMQYLCDRLSELTF